MDIYDHHWVYVWPDDDVTGWWECSLCGKARATLPENICDSCDPIGFPLCSRCVGA
jgi:hypothetical protein